MTQVTTREAVGVFDDLEKLDKAVSELEISKFARHDISVLGNKEKVEERFGQKNVKPEWLEDNPNAPRGISVRPEEKTIGASVMVGVPAYIGGCIAAIAVNPAPHLVLLGAVASGSVLGALIGGAIVFFLNQKITKRINRQIQKGGLLLWVRTPGPQREKIALDILRKHGARHVHLHDISR